MNNDDQWISENLLSHFGVLLDTNMGYLHNTLSWTVTVIIGSIVFIFSRPEFPDHLSLTTLCILIVVVVHFAIRTSKAYINVIRCGLIEKSIITSKLGHNPKELARAREIVVDYHCNWNCPLKKRTIVYKLLFELGFLYFLLPLIGLVIYCGYAMLFDKFSIVILLVSFLVVVVEIYFGFITSPYYRNIKVNDLACKNR